MQEKVAYWNEVASRYVSWMKPWEQVFSGGFVQGQVTWFAGGKLNVSSNCLDRHLETLAEKPALIWEGDSEEQHQVWTFKALHREVCKLANGLKSLGIGKGDAVGIYMPMIPQAAIAMLACTRIGAVHAVVFAGFSSHALKQRLEAAACKLLITADSYQRGGKLVSLKQQADEADFCRNLVVKHQNSLVNFDPRRDIWWDELVNNQSDYCPPQPMDAEDPLFILYTSGSTGKPKGLVHTTGGYLVQTALTHDYVFGCKPGEIFWCTADVGWITGHSYVVYGPLCNGITTLMYEGVPTWPDAGRNWRIIDKHQVNVFYTAPTAIRTLMGAGDNWLNDSSRKSLRLLGTVGEPINPEVWQWYQQKVGLNRCPVVDTWWQTETGAIMISPTYQDTGVKPGAASRPLPGIVPVLLNDKGEEIQGSGKGLLAIKYPWPSLARTIAGDHQRYQETYFLNGYYMTGDGATRDSDGDYWITGRVDDVLNVSGHRIGTAEIESALLCHPKIAEAAVVGVPHEIKGQGIFAYVVLKQGMQEYQTLIEELKETVKTEISAIAKPDVIQFVSELPKTRSGKIMRRILRAIASKAVEHVHELGDLSTLANPHVVEHLIKSK